MSIKSPKKLIEVALPLDDINAAAAREKSIRHGHPSTLHLWWARRPLAAARAVLFAQMVNDPGGERGYFAGKTKKQADAEREKLFQIIRDLVKWENTNNEEVLERARAEIRKSWRETCELNKGKPGFDPEQLPAFHDPFAGGGAIPLEAQRLGLESHASDLNPVAVLINKAMIEIPPKFAGQAPVGPVPDGDKRSKKQSTKDGFEDWSGARGLAEDVRRYGHWMREQAEQRIGHLYPKAKVTAEMARNPDHPRPDLEPYVGEELTVIAWLWARTVKSPNPAFSHVDVPLASSFVLSKKKGKEAWVEPVVEGDRYRFEIRVGTPPAEAKNGTKLARGAKFYCLLSAAPIGGTHIKAEGQAGRMGQRLMAIVAEGKRGRLYLPPPDEHETIAAEAQPTWKSKTPLPNDPRNFWTVDYGLTTYGDLFTPRQLVALTTFSDLVGKARDKAITDAKAAEKSKNDTGAGDGGTAATAYGDALAIYLAFAVDRIADYNCSISTWKPSGQQVMQALKRQALPMTWDFPESNVFAQKGINWTSAAEITAKGLEKIPSGSSVITGESSQLDATSFQSKNLLFSLDPPYYDNISYAGIFDFFYAFLRRTLNSLNIDSLNTIAIPKSQELVADRYRHGGQQEANTFFAEGMSQALASVRSASHPGACVTIYYAFKQSDTIDDKTASTGWSVFLQSIISSGFIVTGTWPIQTEGTTRILAAGNNALSSSIVLVCRSRNGDVGTTDRRDFQRQLREEMPEALETMIGGTTGRSPIAPVDLAQAAIGPGMAIFSKYAAVLNQDGTKMRVHDALILINREISAFLTPDAGNFDSDTLFCNNWFEEFGWSAGAFGSANTLAQAKGTSVGGVEAAGVVESGGGKVRLLRWAEYPDGWDPKADARTPVWEAAHHLIRALNRAGEAEAGALLARMPERGEAIRQLAYHLYTLCERKKWADDARAYNELITAWHAIVAASHETGHRGAQVALGFE